jgi:RNA polymerase sigma-70 factor (ECF subfamily)
MKETTIGGPKDRFPETMWSSILSDPQRDSARRAERLRQLLQDYWKPVYRYIRVCWRKNIEDSKDLTQSFFSHMLSSDLVGKYRPELGRFRAYLLTSVKLYLSELHRKDRRLKRGGGQVVLQLDPVEEENRLQVYCAEQATPEEIYDREWGAELMTRCLEILRKQLAQEDREAHYKLFEAYDLAADPEDRPGYGELAQRMGLKLHDVRNTLVFVRGRLREIVKNVVREYVATAEDLKVELKELSRLLGALKR